MDGVLNILHLEDSSVDALLVERSLKTGRLAARFHRVADMATLEAVVDGPDWHVMISDYNVPGLRFEDALALVRSRRPDLPLIVVSGFLGEETAVELLKQGVWDFVLKGALGRLVPAIQRSLREASENRARAAAERSLRESERRLRLTLEAAHLVTWDWTLDGDGFAETGPTGIVFGRPDDYRHRCFADFLADVHPGDRDRLRDDLRQVASGRAKTSFTFEFRIFGQGDAVRWLMVAGNLLGDDTGAPCRVLGIARDITRQKEADTVLRDQLELQKALMEAIPSPFYYKDTEGRLQGCNKAFAELVDRPRDQIIGQDSLDLTAPVNAAAHLEADAQLLAGRDAIVYEATARFPDGSARDFHMSKALYRHAAGSVAGIAGVMIDITERKRTERRLRQLVLAVEQSPCSIVITDKNGTIEYVNPKFCQTTGYRSDEAIGANPRILKSVYTSQNEYRQLWRTINAGRVWRGELHNRRKDGTMFWESVSISPVKTDGQTITHFVGIKEDITERKRREMELLEAKERAEAGNQAKAQFLAMMNHEFHTPLNAIIGFAEIMATSDELVVANDDRFRNYSQIIVECGRSLMAVLDDILKLSKALSGDMSLQFAPFPLWQLVKGAVATVRARAEAACVHLVAEGADTAVLIDGDQRALHQALVHLLVNGIKFSRPDGTVELRIDCAQDGRLALSVVDQGIGIAAGDIDRIMTPFMQADSSFNRRYEGTGIGLALALRLIEYHGGSLRLDSSIGVGTTATIDIPPERVILLDQASQIGIPAGLPRDRYA